MRKKVTIIVLLLAIIVASAVPSMVSAKNNDKGSWIPKRYQKYCQDIGYKFGVSPELIEAIIEHESSGQAKAYNSRYGCYGLMQINKSVHTDRMKKLGVTDLYNAKQNITVGADILLDLFEECDGDIYWVLMRYHGERNAKAKAESGQYSYYAKSIVNRAYELEEAHGKHNY